MDTVCANVFHVYSSYGRPQEVMRDPAAEHRMEFRAFHRLLRDAACGAALDCARSIFAERATDVSGLTYPEFINALVAVAEIVYPCDQDKMQRLLWHHLLCLATATGLAQARSIDPQIAVQRLQPFVQPLMRIYETYKADQLSATPASKSRDRRKAAPGLPFEAVLCFARDFKLFPARVSKVDLEHLVLKVQALCRLKATGELGMPTVSVTDGGNLACRKFKEIMYLTFHEFVVLLAHVALLLAVERDSSCPPSIAAAVDELVRFLRKPYHDKFSLPLVPAHVPSPAARVHESPVLTHTSHDVAVDKEVTAYLQTHAAVTCMVEEYVGDMYGFLASLPPQLPLPAVAQWRAAAEQTLATSLAHEAAAGVTHTGMKLSELAGVQFFSTPQAKSLALAVARERVASGVTTA